MANRARNTPGTSASRNVIQDTNPLDNVLVGYEKNKKAINTTVVVVLAVILGYFGYQKLYKAPQEAKASTAAAFAQRYFQADSMSLALNGDGQHMGFLKLEKKFEGTATANLCHYYAGVCYLQTGDFASSIKQLQDFDGKGTMLSEAAAGALGDAYMETGNAKKAIECYEKATANKEDGLITPQYLYHAGLAYKNTNQPEKAKEAFKRIRDEYPKSQQARDMDKELALLGELN